MVISCFKDKHSVNEPFTVKVPELLERFKTDRNGIEAMRQLPPDEFTKKKTDLPIACFGGVFSKRSKNSLIQASGLLVLDFDKCDIISKKSELIKYSFVYSVFISPSGAGLKAVVRIPVVSGDMDYKNYYRGLEGLISGIDESGKDICRACFFSYDPEIYINPNATVFDKLVKENVRKLTKGDIKRNDYQTAGRVLKIIQQAVPGERHTKILNASRLMGGYVLAEKISYEEAVRLLEQEAYHCDPEDYQTNKRAVYDGLEDGMKNPLKDLVGELKKEEAEIAHGKIYYTLRDVEDAVEEMWQKGQPRGYEIGTLDKKISIKEGCTTYIYAAPYAGKTQVELEWLVNLSAMYGLRHAIFSPETGQAHDIFIELMTIYARKDFYEGYNNRMSEKEKADAKDFVDMHFIVIDPDDGILTPEEFYDYVDIIERVYNVKIFSTTIDPWNELKHDFKEDNGRQDMYIERMLGMVRRNAAKNKRHNFVITHVQDQQIAVQKETGISYYPIPTYRQVAGGQAWSRKGQQMIAVWRPEQGMVDEDGFPYLQNTTILHVQKSKPKGIGERGFIVQYYDAKKHSYYELLGETQVFAPRKRNDAISDYFNVPKQEDIEQAIKECPF